MLFCGLNLAGKGRGKKKKGPIFKSKLTLPLNLTRFCLPPTIGLAHGQTCCARPAVWCRFNFPSPLPPPSLRFAEIRSWGNCRISGGEIIRWGFGVLHEKKGELFKVLFFFKRKRLFLKAKVCQGKGSFPISLTPSFPRERNQRGLLTPSRGGFC